MLFFRLMIGLLALGLASPLIAQHSLTGHVRDANGEPLTGAHVVLTDIRKGSVADGSGKYFLEGIPVGEYRLQVSYIGYEPYARQVEILPNVERQVIEIQLTEQSYTSDEVVIRDVRAGARTPMTYTNVSQEELTQRNHGQDLPYLLRFMPATVVTSDAGTGIGYTGIRIRGTDPTRTNVTINGIPLNDAESQGVFWVDLPDFASSVQNIQVQRGVGTSTNGTGAFGATINLLTAQLRPEPFARVEGGLGSFSTQRMKVAFGSGLLGDHFSIEGRWSKINSDGYIDRASADLDAYYLSSAWVSDKQSLRFTMFSGKEVTYQAWYGVSPDLLDDPKTRTFNVAGTERPGSPHDNEVDDYKQTHYQLHFNRSLGVQTDVQAALHYTRGLGFFEQYKADQSFGAYGVAAPMVDGMLIDQTDLTRRLWLDNHFYGLTYALRQRDKGNRLEATLGGGYSIYEGDHYGTVNWAEVDATLPSGTRYYENDARKTDFNIYTKWQYELRYGFFGYLDLQYRRVGYEFLGVNQDLQPVTQTDELSFFNPKAGLLYRFSDSREAYLSLGVAQREPNRNDYTTNTLAERPKAESLYDLELGYRATGETLSWSANAYYMLYRDQLAVNGRLNAVGESLRTNIDRSHRLGVELISTWQPHSRWQVQTNLALSQNKIDQFDTYLDVYDADFNFIEQQQRSYDNTDLAFSPSVVGTAQLAYDFLPRDSRHALQASYIHKYVSQQYLDNLSDGDNILEAYHFGDIQLRYKTSTSWTKGIEVSLLLRNVYDQLFETNAWSYRYIFDGSEQIDQGFYPQAGRNILVNLAIEF